MDVKEGEIWKHYKGDCYKIEVVTTWYGPTCSVAQEQKLVNSQLPLTGNWMSMSLSKFPVFVADVTGVCKAFPCYWSGGHLGKIYADDRLVCYSSISSPEKKWIQNIERFLSLVEDKGINHRRFTRVKSYLELFKSL